MKGYGQYCPVAKGAEVFAERWTPLVLRELLLGSSHFSDLHRGVPLMSRSLLSLRLKQLEEIGVVERRQRRLGSEYYLTQSRVWADDPSARTMGPVVPTQICTTIAFCGLDRAHVRWLYAAAGLRRAFDRTSRSHFRGDRRQPR